MCLSCADGIAEKQRPQAAASLGKGHVPLRAFVLSQQIRQLGDVGGYAPGLVAGELSGADAAT